MALAAHLRDLPAPGRFGHQQRHLPVQMPCFPRSAQNKKDQAFLAIPYSFRKLSSSSRYPAFRTRREPNKLYPLAGPRTMFLFPSSLPSLPLISVAFPWISINSVQHSVHSSPPPSFREQIASDTLCSITFCDRACCPIDFSVRG